MRPNLTRDTGTGESAQAENQAARLQTPIANTSKDILMFCKNMTAGGSCHAFMITGTGANLTFGTSS